jgi:hypothetical protein
VSRREAAFLTFQGILPKSEGHDKTCRLPVEKHFRVLFNETTLNEGVFNEALATGGQNV